MLRVFCPCRFVEFLLVRYSVQVALGLFITVGGLLLAAFLAYQVCLRLGTGILAACVFGGAVPRC